MTGLLPPPPTLEYNNRTGKLLPTSALIMWLKHAFEIGVTPLGIIEMLPQLTLGQIAGLRLRHVGSTSPVKRSPKPNPPPVTGHLKNWPVSRRSQKFRSSNPSGQTPFQPAARPVAPRGLPAIRSAKCQHPATDRMFGPVCGAPTIAATWCACHALLVFGRAA
jgi:hypothetical protein